MVTHDRYKKNIEHYRAYSREYSKKWRQKNREKYKAIQRKKLEKLLKEYRNAFPKVCFLCGSTKHIELHEKNGKKHPKIFTMRERYVLKHKDDFVPLCKPCHQMVHRMMKVFNFTWETIVSFRGGNT
jgi:hypothetical protein